MRQIYSLMIAAAFYTATATAQNTHTVASPDGNIKAVVTLGDAITYDVYHGDELVLDDCRMALNVNGRVLGSAPRLKSVQHKVVDEVKHPFLTLKYAEVPNRYNMMKLCMRDGYSVEFRAFDDGVAYRFVTNLGGEINVYDEDITLFVPRGTDFVLQQSDSYRTSYEERYSFVKSDNWKSFDKLAHLPIFATTPSGVKVLIAEADRTDYPAPFFRGNDSSGFSSAFPRIPADEKPRNDKSVDILLRKPYIATTKGTRSFPWRYFVISNNDAAFIETTMTCRLAQDSRLDDTSWIVPGQASWEWWNGAIPYGPDVTFKAGLNVETYKYFMDFAANYGIKYIVMDEGWAKDNMDPYTPNPACDLHEIIAHGEEMGVGVILWLTWRCVEENPGLFAKFQEWGVKGVKIDFMDRSDQWMVNFYERTVAEAARHNIFVNYHGAFTPAGLEYMYPNLLSYEGVAGMEQMGNCNPKNSIYFPFIRNAVGPMEYTPGAMNSMQPDNYSARRPNSGSIGTRAYQMALFVVFESGIQMLADNPTLYYQNDDCTRFISSVPQLWDDTRVLSAKVGDNVVVAKRRADKWFIGGITAERTEPLEMDITLDFLSEGKTYILTSFEDGVNADRQAMHYVQNVKNVKKGDTIRIKMVRNGGYAAELRVL